MAMRRRALVFSLFLLAGCSFIAVASVSDTSLTLDAHWDHPLPPQGDPPQEWSDLEKSLHPDQCGTCHVEQKKLWKGSRHAVATGPGYHAQIFTSLKNADEKKERGRYFMCTRCHIPLHEQRAVLRDGTENPDFDQALYDSGLNCAGCHVREHVRHGPPPRTEPLADAPHSGFQVRPFFQSSEFCANCHQHQVTTRNRLNGKRFEDTFEEWKKTSFAKEGITCQTCHMPDRQHLWRGIHDKATVAGGLTIALSDPVSSGGRHRVTLSVASTNIGHLFPTYLPPQVLVDFHQADGGGKVIEGTQERYRIGWYSENLRTEIADSRLRPGEERAYTYRWQPAPGAEKVVARLWVDPDENYRRVYQKALMREQDPAAVNLFKEALQDTFDNRFTVFERSVPARGTP